MNITPLKPGETAWYPIPKGYAECPKCKGTGIGDALTEKDLSYSWNKGKTHFRCNNCGGQTMGGTPLGYSKINPDTGLGCLHQFVGREAGRCYRIYTCIHCKYNYDIDSGD